LQWLERDERLLFWVSVAILIFVAISCVGAEWCRHHDYCPDAQSQQYANDCATNGWVMFWATVYWFIHIYREDVNATATAILALFTVVLAFAARRQAILTRDALRVASEHAGYMETMVDVNKSMQRAFLAIDGLGIENFFVGVPIVRISISNTGHLVAKRVKWIIDAAIDAEKRKADFPINESAISRSNNIIAPGASMIRFFDPRFPESDIEKVEVGASVVYVWGIVHYTDGFDRDRWTRFCHRYEIDCRTDFNNLSFERVRQHQYGNGTDEDEIP
jgi:hypothetical protein